MLYYLFHMNYINLNETGKIFFDFCRGLTQKFDTGNQHEISAHMIIRSIWQQLFFGYIHRKNYQIEQQPIYQLI